MDRRALLAGSAAGLWAASARAQQACFDRMDCFDTQLPGPSLDLQFTGGSLDPRITFTRASVATYFDVAGVLQTAGTNVARFDYDPVTHAAKGLLIEEARTNLLLNSATLGTQSVTVTAAATTLSFYGTGTVTLSGTFAGSLVGSGAFPTRSTLTFTPTAGSLTCTVTGSVLNAQVETGAFATSWISTAGASATRAADVATMPVGGWFNAAAGTWGCELVWPSLNPGALIQRVLFVTDGGSNYHSLFRNTASVGVSENSLVAGVAPGRMDAGTPVAGGVIKTAFSTIASSRLLCVNGGTPTAAAIGGQPTGLTTVYIGNDLTWPMGGYLSRLRYWPRSLGASELQAVTR